VRAGAAELPRGERDEPRTGRARLPADRAPAATTTGGKLLIEPTPSTIGAAYVRFGSKAEDAGHLRIFQPHPGTPSLLLGERVMSAPDPKRT